jgi:hypothetical protein
MSGAATPAAPGGAAIRGLASALCLSLLQWPASGAAPATKDNVEVRAYVDDTCIVADEPYFVPQDAADQSNARFLPLIGVIVGKLVELYVNHGIESSAERMKSRAARKDTRYATSRQMNLYRADFDPSPMLHINAKLGCMTIVAASFQPEPANCAADYLPKELSRETRDLPQSQWKTSRSDDSVENQLRRANVCVNGKAKAVYEARFEFSKDGTAYRLRDAGYRIESLLTTADKGASRITVYTLKISDPSVTDTQEVLSSAWVNIGTVSAGSHAAGGKDDAAPWLRVPPLSVEARRIYEEKSKLQQEVAGEIEALKRAQTRNQRMLDSLDARIAAASRDPAAGSGTVAGLKQERTRIAVQDQTQGAELDARNAEYLDLPRSPLEFMPVTIEVAVTETESEQKSRLALADIIGKNSDIVGGAIGSSATSVLSRSLPAAGKNAPDSADSDGGLAAARARYYDALVESQSAASGKPSEDAQRSLALRKDEYNAARRSQGLEPIK